MFGKDKPQDAQKAAQPAPTCELEFRSGRLFQKWTDGSWRPVSGR